VNQSYFTAEPTCTMTISKTLIQPKIIIRPISTLCQAKVIVSANCGVEVKKIIDYKVLLDQAIELSAWKPQTCIIYNRKHEQVRSNNVVRLAVHRYQVILSILLCDRDTCVNNMSARTRSMKYIGSKLTSQASQSLQYCLRSSLARLCCLFS